MNLLEYLLNINGNIDSVNEQPIKVDSKEVGWHSHVKLYNGEIIGSGTSSNKDTSRRIAIAESIERSLFLSFSDDVRKYLYVDKIPSSSGCAAGFDKEKTRLRSLFEAVERWSWSKWIDEELLIKEVVPLGLSDLSRYLQSQFDSVKYFHKKIIMDQHAYKGELYFLVSIAYKGSGVFVGSRVSNLKGYGYEHALIESFRNYNNFVLLKNNGYKPQTWLEERLFYFAENKNDLKKYLTCERNYEWGSPEILFSKEVDTLHPEVYFFRTIIKDYLYWHLGDETRFVY